MKKIVTLVLFICLTLMAEAGCDVRLKSGSVPSINVRGVTIYMEFDYSADRIFDENTGAIMTEHEFCVMKGDDWVKDEGKDHAEAERSFSEQLNKQHLKVVAVSSREEARYTIVWHIDLFCYGNPPVLIAAPFYANKVKGFAEGRFDIIDNATGQVVATLSQARTYGSEYGYSWSIQREYIYDNVAKELAKFLKKAK